MSYSAKKRPIDLIALILLAFGGVVLLAMMEPPYWRDIRLGHTDFLSFYAGGRLAFTPHLYDPQIDRAEELRTAHVAGKGTYFIRMPWFAAAMWPLARLHYLPAQLLWQCLLIAALVAFAALWPRPSPAVRAAILCYSFPALMCLQMGQDVPLLVAWMAVSLALIRRGKPTAAGFVLALTLAKFHLFLPLFPAVLLARRKRLARGFFGGTAILLAVSFLVGGAAWPKNFLAAIRNPETIPRIVVTPSFYYLFHNAPGVHDLLIAAIGMGLLILYLRRAHHDIEFLIAAAPVVMLPLLPHAGAYDCLLLAPLAMTALHAESRAANAAGALLLFPVTYFLAWSSSLAVIVPILDVALLGFYALPARVSSIEETGPCQTAPGL